MIYLSNFSFPSSGAEDNYLAFNARAKYTCYDSYYPFGVFREAGRSHYDLTDITILYGGNGSGKTTALNVMADALRLNRGAAYNRTDFFADYVRLCQFDVLHAIPPSSLILTSDDVFDYMLDLRTINDKIDTRRGELFDEVTEARSAKFQMHSMEDYDRLKEVSQARRMSKSQIARRNLAPQRAHPVQWGERLSGVSGEAQIQRPVPAGRAGKQPLGGAADGAGPVSERLGAVLPVSVCDRHPLPLSAGHSRRTDL